MQSIQWRRNAISAAVSAAICATAVAPAFAADETLEEVIVTGIRASLQQSMDLKRNAVGVVDAITAEDMGKFPDTNLAESLQRITGVSIDRNNGEGKNVTVRGFGAQFNLVTLNGRQLPSASVGTITAGGNPDAQGTSRSFDFSVLASEGVSGVQVYKTGNAAVPTGGIGATINISTIKPLEAGNKASVGAKLDHEAGGKKSATPEFSGLWSWVNDSKTFGVSAFGSYQDRSFGSRAVNVANYWFANWVDNPTQGPFFGTTVDNKPAAGQLIATPANIGINDAFVTRKRTNAMLTVQFAPDENTTFTADALYTVNKLQSNSLVPGLWYNQNFKYVKFDGSSVVDTPTLMVEDPFTPTGRGKDYFFASFDDATKDTMSEFGFNVKHKTGNWTLEGDASTALSKSGGDGPRGYNDWRMNLALAGAGWQAVNYGGGVPTASVGVTDNALSGTNVNGKIDIPDLSTETGITTLSTQKTKTDQFNLSGTWDNNDGIVAKLGLGTVRTGMDQFHSNTTDFLGGWGVGCVYVTPALNNNCATDINSAAQALIRQVNVLNDFKYLNVGAGYPNAATAVTPGYVLTTLGKESFQIPVYQFMQAMNGYQAFAPKSATDRTLVPVSAKYDINNLGQGGQAYDNNTIAENVVSLYGQVKIDGEVAGHKTQTVAGLRYEKTTMLSTSRQKVPQYITWKSDNDFVQVLSPDVQSLHESNSYSNVLPNIDFVFDVTSTVKARASVSKTIARPQYDRMFLKTQVNPNATPGLLNQTATASSGTAKLAPLVSTNFDFSLEWYYGDSDYASIGYYMKDVNNFLGTQVVKQSLFGLRDVSAGPLAQAAAAALKAGGYAITEPNLFTMAAILSDPTNFPTGAAAFVNPATDGGGQQLAIIAAYDLNPTANDPLIQFATSLPVNNKTAQLHGVEAAWQHFFGHSGFGFQVNATFVGGDTHYNVNADPSIDQFALEGLSNSANLVLIYEKHGLSSRLAYNWRDAFLAAAVFQGNQGKPAFVDAHRQLDLNVTYNFNNHFSVGLDGVNLTHEGLIMYSRTKNMQWLNAEVDPRYMLTANYKF
jgi:TonB-dependent receptor